MKDLIERMEEVVAWHAFIASRSDKPRLVKTALEYEATIREAIAALKAKEARNA